MALDIIIGNILQHWDYDKAVKIYDEHGTNSTNKVLFASGESSFTSPKLKAALSEIRDKIINAPGTPEERQHPTDYLKGAPTYILDLQKRKTQLWREASNLHGQLKVTESQNTRYKIALNIYENMQENEKLYKQLNFYAENGYLPDEAKPKPNEIDLFKIFNDLKNVEPNISKYKKSGRMDKVEMWERRREALKSEIKNYNRILNGRN